MFNPAEETEIGWDEDIKQDVTDECAKFGNLEFCHVDKVKPSGVVLLRFTAVFSAVQCANALHNRFFAGRTISASFVDAAQFDALVASSS